MYLAHLLYIYFLIIKKLSAEYNYVFHVLIYFVINYLSVALHNRVMSLCATIVHPPPLHLILGPNR